MHWIIVKLGDKIVKHHRIDSDSFTIGRAKDNGIVIENLSVSRNHARIERKGGEYHFTDLNSSNGSYVNGNRVTQVTLVPGDMISIGKYRLHFAVGSDPDEASRGLEGPAAENRRSPSSAANPVDTSQPKADGPLGRRLASGEIAAALIVKRGKQQSQVFLVGVDDVVLGRHGCDVRLHDISVGRNHAVIRLQDDHFLLRDLGSWNGTIVNGEKIRERRLANGDEIIIGSTILEFLLTDRAEIDDLKEASDRRRQLALGAGDVVDVHQLKSGTPAPAKIPSSATAVPVPDSRPVSEVLDDDLDSIRLDPSITGGVPVATSVPAPAADPEDDEYAPMTDEELAALEEDADDAFLHVDADAIRRAEWEQVEAERMLKEGGGMDVHRAGALIDGSDNDENSHIRPPGPGEEVQPLGDEVDEEELVLLEEQALFRGPVQDVDANADAAPDDSVSVSPEALARHSPSPDDSGVNLAVPDGVDPQEYRRWMRGLRNRSKVVRREAARKLKELTGIDYDWESEPKQ